MRSSSTGLSFFLFFSFDIFLKPYQRQQGLCPGTPLHHGALMDCGMGLFSLEDAFGSLFKANAAFWDIISWFASFFRPSSSSNAGIQGIFESFLTGFAAYGEAGHIVSLYEVSSFQQQVSAPDACVAGERYDEHDGYRNPRLHYIGEAATA